MAARSAGRTPLVLYHSAPKVCLDRATYVIEVAPVWSRPERERGVLAGGAVGSRWLGALLWFRVASQRCPSGLGSWNRRKSQSPST